MPWQIAAKVNPKSAKSLDHFPISRCCSVLALSLSGEHISRLDNTNRGARVRKGYVYDPWAAWQVLNIQCHPDHRHTMKIEEHEGPHNYLNGPEAFLRVLLSEFRDAHKRFSAIHHRISEIVTPPVSLIIIPSLAGPSVEKNFIHKDVPECDPTRQLLLIVNLQNHVLFNLNLRDQLIFDDEDFTYTRRYSWTYQMLDIIKIAILDITEAYRNTFSAEFWEGKHDALWPLLDQGSPRNKQWIHRMKELSSEFEESIRNLERLYEENDDLKKNVRSLKDQLFAGTSVMESRKSSDLAKVTILEGRNIKLLTMVSGHGYVYQMVENSHCPGLSILFASYICDGKIFQLASSFLVDIDIIQSIFGMTNMSAEPSFKLFGIVMASVCTPFFLLIGLLNTTAGLGFLKYPLYPVTFGVTWMKRFFAWVVRRSSTKTTSRYTTEINMQRRRNFARQVMAAASDQV